MCKARDEVKETKIDRLIAAVDRLSVALECRDFGRDPAVLKGRGEIGRLAGTQER